MSYTLSIEEPETKALLERETANVSAAELSALFAKFLVQRNKHEAARRGGAPRRRTAERVKDDERDLTRRKEPMREVTFDVPVKHRLSGLLKPDAPLPTDWDYHTLIDERVRERCGVSWM